MRPLGCTSTGRRAHDPIGALVLGFDARNITAVLINGESRKWNGQVLDVNLAAVRSEVHGSREYVLKGCSARGAGQEEPSFEHIAVCSAMLLDPHFVSAPPQKERHVVPLVSMRPVRPTAMKPEGSRSAFRDRTPAMDRSATDVT
ncbi:hypothetical protein [Streptomyces sp. NPDC090798]|uniref:hypothetical protein n=1 Tax=Streptomyces sp. NPDC090798 TaxID=3365968 RepID=UPI0037F8DB18